jgi:HlyD family secretion protein
MNPFNGLKAFAIARRLPGAVVRKIRLKVFTRWNNLSRLSILSRSTLLFSAILIIALLYWLAQGKAASDPSKYLTAAAEMGELRRVVTATGTLNATINVEVGSQLSGQIAEILVDFNDHVHQGQPLARLEQKSWRARVDEAVATLEVAKASVGTARSKVERAEIDARDTEAQRAVLKARTDTARVKLEAASSTLERKDALQAKGVTAAAELENERSRAALAAAAAREAYELEATHENKIAASRAEIRRAQSELDTALASVAQKEALLQVARIDLDRTTIRSPIDGVLVGRNINGGQTLATTMEAKTLFVIAGDLQEMEIHAKVDEADIGKIQSGQEASFTVDAHPGRQFRAKVRQLRKAPQVLQNVVTYTVVLTAANHNNLLLPGMTALVRITVEQTGPVLKIPVAALRFSPRDAGARPQPQRTLGKSDSGTSASLWVAGQNGEPKAIVVGIGADDATQVAIVSGSLRRGDQVIVGEVADHAPKRLFGIRVGL